MANFTVSQSRSVYAVKTQGIPGTSGKFAKNYSLAGVCFMTEFGSLSIYWEFMKCLFCVYINFTSCLVDPKGIEVNPLLDSCYQSKCPYWNISPLLLFQCPLISLDFALVWISVTIVTKANRQSESSQWTIYNNIKPDGF